MNVQTLTICLIGTIFSAAWVIPAWACTDVLLQTQDGSIVDGRSMEFAVDLKSRLAVYPRGEQYSSTAPGEKTGLKWTSKYGYLATNVLGTNYIVDGMNERGLSFGFLWYPDCQYQDVPANNTNNAIAVMDLGNWILGNFATTLDVKEAISQFYIWGKFMPELKQIPPLHIALHDASGKSLVIEFIGGKQKIYDNPNGILTNAPSFDWHITNLRNYLSLNPKNPQPIKVDDTVLASPGQGGGFLGIPGDWTPPSRFVRTTIMKQFAKPAIHAAEGVNLIEHILNAVDIPRGNIREKKNGSDTTDYTQWIVIKDLTNKVLYFRSYDNLSLRQLDLKKLNLSTSTKEKSTQQTSIPIAGGYGIVDISSELVSH